MRQYTDSNNGRHSFFGIYSDVDTKAEKSAAEHIKTLKKQCRQYQLLNKELALQNTRLVREMQHLREVHESDMKRKNSVIKMLQTQLDCLNDAVVQTSSFLSSSDSDDAQ